MQGKTGKRSTREVNGPIHVFEGKRKPGLTGWPKGITWMVSQTWKGSLDNVKWPTSLVGIVLMVRTYVTINTGHIKPLVHASYHVSEIKIVSPYSRWNIPKRDGTDCCDDCDERDGVGFPFRLVMYVERPTNKLLFNTLLWFGTNSLKRQPS